MRVEERVEARDLQHVANPRRHGAEPEVPTRGAASREQPHQETKPAAVDELDVRKVQDDTRIVWNHVQVLLERVGLGALYYSAGERDHRDVTDQTAVQRERHEETPWQDERDVHVH